MKRRIWTEVELAVVRKFYADTASSVIAAALGRPLSQVYGKAAKLGLKKSDAFLASEDACRLRRGDQVGKAHRFPKGHQPWNKGTKGIHTGGEATQFKKGSKPHTTLPVGSYRHDKSGNLQRKIGEASGNNSVRWRGVHELVWIDANGPVPPKHIVVFKPGMRTGKLEEITIDKVECISLADHMRRNTLHRYPKEIVSAIQMRGALNRRINREQQDNR
ncbi:HNH endonuclease [Alcaligenaceae bacterium C4P045]|nr:HNH endonuclease [Alcaligenaceae bacterium C4P045]